MWIDDNGVIRKMTAEEIEKYMGEKEFTDE